MERVTIARSAWLVAAWSRRRWQRSGQSCISPSMAFSCGPYVCNYMARRSDVRGRLGRALKVTGMSRLRNRRICGAAPGVSKSREGKSCNVVAGCTGDRKIGEDLADHRREFEAMTGAGRSDDDVGSAAQAIDEKMAVGGRRVEAGLGRDEPAVCCRKMRWQRRADQCLVIATHCLIVSGGIDRFLAVMMLGDFDAGLQAGIGWNSIVQAMPAL